MGFLLEPRSSRTGVVATMFWASWLLIFLVESSFAARMIDLKWEVEYKHWSPDCIDSVVMVINGTFPGPTIEATAGDTINITLTNHLQTEGVVIHWHGITQVIIADELMDDGEYEEILEDMKDEGGKFGDLVSVVIPRPSPSGEQEISFVKHVYY